MSDNESHVSASQNGDAVSHKGKDKQRVNDGRSEQVKTAASSRDGDNPFRIPSDDLIFTFKEDERKKKMMERESNKNKKIWEKNRPVREGCLRKLCETDIEPSQLAINQKVASKVNVMEFSSFTVPIERPKNQETRH
jgi:hypothetical protein